jgi:ribose transport system permease protein
MTLSVTTDPAASGSRTERDAEVAEAPVIRRSHRFGLERIGTLLFFLLFFAVISVLKGSEFLSWGNIERVISQNSYAALLAAAVTLPLIAGQFDLSVGAVAGLSAIICAALTTKTHTPLLLAIILSVLSGGATGVVNGLLVTRARINAFIATLGTGGALGGIALWLSGGSPIFNGIPVVLTDASQNSLVGISLPLLYVVIATVLLWALTTRTVAGRFWYAAGSNAEGARLAGVRVNAMIVWAFVVTGLLAAVAGVLYLSIFASADPKTGPDLLLPPFAGAFLGSSILSDGRFTMIGSILGTFLVAYASNGLQVAGVNFAAQPIFNALVLVGAVGFTEHLRRRRIVGRGARRARTPVEGANLGARE